MESLYAVVFVLLLLLQLIKPVNEEAYGPAPEREDDDEDDELVQLDDGPLALTALSSRGTVGGVD